MRRSDIDPNGNHASTALAVVVVAAAATPGVFEWKLTCTFTASTIPAAAPPGRRIIPSIHFRLLGYLGSLLPRPGLRRSFRLPAPCAKHIPGLDDVLYDALHTLRVRSPPAAVAISGLGVSRDVLHLPHYAHARRWPLVRMLARRSRRCMDLVHDPRLALRCTHGRVRRLPLLRWLSAG
ncbi:hypothetical protein B0H14DRAFT_3425583 [Mycena olivaceomarginata]|nr:hypothetical protein B0H14DRAFT_3425583 [Mycena olivaceomarginata]